MKFIKSGEPKFACSSLFNATAGYGPQQVADTFLPRLYRRRNRSLQLLSWSIRLIWMLSISGISDYATISATSTQAEPISATNLYQPQPRSAEFDLALVMVPSVSGAYIGEDVTFVIYVKNQGTTNASNIEIYHWLPSGFDFNTALNSGGWQATDNVLIYIIASLEAGEMYTLSLVLTVNADAAAILVNTAEIRTAIDNSTGDVGLDQDSTMDNANPDPNNDKVNDRLNPADVNIDSEVGDEDDHDVAVIVLDIPLSPTIAIQTEVHAPEMIRPGDTIQLNIRITNTSIISIHELSLTGTYASVYMSFATATPQPNNTQVQGQIAWDNLVESLEQALGPGKVFEVVVHFTAQRDTILEPDGHTLNIVSTSLGDSAEIPIQISALNTINFAAYSVQYKSKRVVAVWETLDDAEIAGFHLYRKHLEHEEESVTGEGATVSGELFSDFDPSIHNLPQSTQVVWQRLTEQLLGVQTPPPPTCVPYRVEDTSVSSMQTYGYMLEVVKLNGSSIFIDLGEVYTAQQLYLPILGR